MTFCTVTVLAIIVQLALLCCFPRVRDYVGLTKRRKQNEPNVNFELFRIEQRKQAAMEDIRRRRLYAEDQMRRLGRWSR